MDAFLPPDSAMHGAAAERRRRSPARTRVREEADPGITRRALADQLAVLAVLCAYAWAGAVPRVLAGALAGAAIAFDLLLFAPAARRWWIPRLGWRPEAVQLIVACLLPLSGIALLPSIGVAFIALLFAPLCHAVLHLQRDDHPGVWMLLMSALAIALALADFRAGTGGPGVLDHVLLVGSLALAMGRFLAVQAEAAGMRAQLHGRNERLARRSAKLAHLAAHDFLTGLPNRREGMRILQAESERADRCATGLWVAVIDVDHFKQVNDHHGHDVGDEVLRELGQVLFAQVRSVDHVFRWGGEEFLLLLVDHASGHAAVPLERLREAVSRHDWGRIVPGLSITVSIGLAQRARAEAPERVLRRADGALYEAKDSGRDCVRVG
jgi:diguanylate cyclase (GGDEF)-like protein